MTRVWNKIKNFTNTVNVRPILVVFAIQTLMYMFPFIHWFNLLGWVVSDCLYMKMMGTKSTITGKVFNWAFPKAPPTLPLPPDPEYEMFLREARQEVDAIAPADLSSEDVQQNISVLGFDKPVEVGWHYRDDEYCQCKKCQPPKQLSYGSWMKN